ncbi:MAG: lysophospholipid acyltransferase family protein, partial [Microthrixaceae bacterium]
AWFWGAIPMERKKVSRRSALAAAELIDDGWSLLVFPEGGRSPDGWGQEHKGGAAYLGVRCGVPVVPIHIEGTDRVLPKDAKMPHPGTVTVNFGAPMRHGELDARRFAARIEATVELLAEETTTDWYSARLAASAGESPSLRGPDTDSWRRRWLLEERRATRGTTRSSYGAASGSARRSLRDRARGNPPW